jgi:signal transduction histidine kinase
VTAAIVHSGKADAVDIMAELELGEATCWINTDKHWLKENLLCYMSNAVKFVTKGSIVVKASVEYDDDSHGDMDAAMPTIGSQESGGNKATKQNPNDTTLRTHSTDVLTPSTSSRRGFAKIAPMLTNSTALENGSSGRYVMASESPPPTTTTTNKKTIKYIRFSVTDTGIGIPKDKRSGLFQPFYQAYRGAGGTGLGLFALSKRIEAIGGRYGMMSARSDSEQGCSFWFSVPYRPDTEMNADNVTTLS